MFAGGLQTVILTDALAVVVMLFAGLILCGIGQYCYRRNTNDIID